MILPFVNIDPFVRSNEAHHYVVRSIYFDSPELDYYFEKIEGVPNRKKIRLRGYDTPESSNSTVFTEIKRKFQIPIKKDRAKLKFDEAIKLFNHDLKIEDVWNNANQLENANRFFYHIGKANLKPVVLVAYDREPYLSKTDETIRVTIDKNLRSYAFPSIEDLYTDHQLKLVMPNTFILEVKFNKFYPSWMKSIAHTLNLKQVSASKYCLSIDAQHMLNQSTKFKVISNAKLFKEKYARRSIRY